MLGAFLIWFDGKKKPKNKRKKRKNNKNKEIKNWFEVKVYSYDGPSTPPEESCE